MRRWWRLIALCLLGASLTTCGQAANGTGEPAAPVNQQQPNPVLPPTQLPQHGSD